MFDDRDIDLPTLTIARLVAKIKNASRKAKPFRTIIERPDGVGFRQQVDKPPNKLINPALLGAKKPLCQTLARLELPHVHGIHDAYSVTRNV